LQKELAARGLIPPASAAGDTVAESFDNEFCGLTFRIDPKVFTPHPASALVVDAVIQHTQDIAAPVVADVGIGCGALAVVYALQRRDALVYGTDNEAAAVECARANAAALGATNVEVLYGSLLQPLIERSLQFDVLIANLPWIAPAIVEVMDLSAPEGWRGPRGSVQGMGRDGLDLHRSLIRDALVLIRPGGALIVGMDEWQKPIITEEFAADYDTELRALPFYLILHPRPGAGLQLAP
jgi:release factor glutamine methyltransferase